MFSKKVEVKSFPSLMGP